MGDTWCHRKKSR